MKPAVPRFPLWFLTTFGCGRDVDTLIGDLTEEYRAGRSTMWLWRQALSGVASTVRAEVRAQPLLMLQAAAVGPLVVLLVLRVGWNLYGTIEHFRLIRASYTFMAFALAGWGIAHFYRPNHKAAIIVSACPLLLRGIGRFVWQTSLRHSFPGQSLLFDALQTSISLLPFYAAAFVGLFTGVVLARVFRPSARDRVLA